jgi:Ferritin-like domain
MSATRRTLLLATAGLAVGASTARAETDEGGLLLGLWRREMNANFAYAEVVNVDPLFHRLRLHEWEHAGALATELAAVGLGTPQRPEALSDLDATAERLACARGREAVLLAAGALEDELVALYKSALAGLPDAKIAMTAATILASHSQHRLMLPREDGADTLTGS